MNCPKCNAGPEHFTPNGKKVDRKRDGAKVQDYKCSFCKQYSRVVIEEGKTKEKPKEEKTVWAEDKNSATLSGKAVDADELIIRYGVDMKVWELDRMEIKENAWDVTMDNRDQDLVWKEKTNAKGEPIQIMTGYGIRKEPVTKTNKQKSIKISFKRRKEIFDHEKFMKDLMVEFKNFSPKAEKIKYPSYNKDKHLLEIALVDLHYDKLGWEGETGQLSYDTKIAAKRFKQCTQAHLDHAINSGINIEKIIFVTSQDFFNSDSDYPFSSTTKKTPQQTDLRWQKSFQTGWRLNAECI